MEDFEIVSNFIYNQNLTEVIADVLLDKKFILEIFTKNSNKIKTVKWYDDDLQVYITMPAETLRKTALQIMGLKQDKGDEYLLGDKQLLYIALFYRLEKIIKDLIMTD